VRLNLVVPAVTRDRRQTPGRVNVGDVASPAPGRVNVGDFASPAPIARAHAVAAARVTDAAFLATLFTVTFMKLRWDSAGGMVLADVLTAVFLAALALELLLRRDQRPPRAAVEILVIGGCLLAVYTTGLLSATQVEGGPIQVAKGLMRLSLHFAALAGGVTYLALRPREYLWRAVGALCAGAIANALYAAAQLVVHAAGGNLDALATSPLTGRPARTLLYGLNDSSDVPRLTGLTMDPNVLAIMLLVPILLLLPIYLQLESRDRFRLPVALLIAALLLVAAATLSRSALLGLMAGAAVLSVRYRRQLWSRRLLVPTAAVALALVIFSAVNPAGSAHVVVTRLRVDDNVMTHVHQYDFVPRALDTNAEFGIGLENFGLRYASITGDKDFGPHSFYVQSLTETGVVGTFAFAGFLAYIAVRLRAAARAAATPKEEALVVGFAAVLVGTMAANIFYLTMTFYYFYAFLILVCAVGVTRARGT
jgi:O-antigen ligase